MNAPTPDHHRDHMLSVAQRIMGPCDGAEDAVQEAAVKAWAYRGPVENEKAFLTKLTVRTCIDLLRRSKRRAELEEKAETAEAFLPEDPVELSESLSVAFSILLERLAPMERSALLLRVAFDLDYDEVASTIDRSVVATRQIVRRARSKLAEGRPRFESQPDRARELAESFCAACVSGEVGRVQALLAEDCRLQARGRTSYGRATAIRRPILGAASVAQFLVAVERQAPERGLTIRAEGDIASVTISISGQRMATMHLLLTGGPDGRVQEIAIEADP